MFKFSFKIDEKELLKFLDKSMDEIALNIFSKSQQNIIQKKIVDRGTLLKSGFVEKKFLNKSIIYDTPYADLIEYGRNPGTMPPVNLIQNWVRRKGIEKDEKKSLSIAWAISKDIQKKGISPRPFLQPAVNEILNKKK